MSCSTNHILISSPTPPSQQIISWMVSSILYIEASVSMSRLHSPRLTFVTHSSPLASVSQLHGRAWKIHNKELLINEIAPKYFVQSKYQSFARQLNGWGFKHLHRAGNDFNAYYHECFLRGMPQLAALMKWASPKQGRLIPRVEAEPNFYEMEKFIKLPSLGMRPDHFQYPPTVASGPGYVFPPAPPSGYYNGSNDFSSNPGTYPPLPPPLFYHPDDPHAVAASYASNLGHPSYPPYYNPMPYSPPPPPLEQYPHFSHPTGLQYGAGSLHGVVSPSTSDPVSCEEASSSSYLPSSVHVSSYSPKDKIVVQEQPPQDDE